ncbi:MAG: FAD-dependent oxidoreductase [Acidimicrobiales bacterium]
MLNTGTRPFVPAHRWARRGRHLDNTSILALTERPDHLVIVGGSYIGLEMGQIFRRLGSAVTVVEQSAAVASREDPEFSAMIREALEAEGVDIRVSTAVQRVRPGPGGRTEIHLDDGTMLEASHLLLAVGRVPNTDRMGLDTIGIELTPRGQVVTNDRLETNVPGVWALGDINGRGAFTHTSYHDHEIVLANWGGGSRGTDQRIPTYAMFTDPPLGHVGIHEYEARTLVDEGRRISMATLPMSAVSRAREESETIGSIKLLVDDDSGKFLGATMLGIGADELVQVIGQLMAAGATWHSVREALPIHPTVTEFLPTILDLRQPLG